MTKSRADQLLITCGLAKDAVHATQLILAGKVYLPHKRIESAGEKVDEDAVITVKQSEHPYVSRGGVKLEAALRTFKIDVKNRHALDIGISTGGFTDCLLQHGAQSVTGIDVGYGQVDYRLQRDSRVKLHERTNVLKFNWGEIADPVSVVTIDVSFMSAMGVLSHLSKWLNGNGDINRHALHDSTDVICLHKPQFEVEKHHVEKGGIVRDESARLASLEKTLAFARDLGFGDGQWIESPITGHKGNVEYLVWWRLSK